MDELAKNIMEHKERDQVMKVYTELKKTLCIPHISKDDPDCNQCKKMRSNLEAIKMVAFITRSLTK